jgi:hypothetical protein
MACTGFVSRATCAHEHDVERSVTAQLLRALATTLMLGATSACKPSWTIGLQEGSSATAPEFSLVQAGTSKPARIAAFRVDACAARGSPPIDTHWLTVAPGARQSVERIVYGVPPAGWRTAQGPHALTPGCYRAAVGNAPPLEFDVLTDGRVTARR